MLTNHSRIIKNSKIDMSIIKIDSLGPVIGKFYHFWPKLTLNLTFDPEHDLESGNEPHKSFSRVKIIK